LLVYKLVNKVLDWFQNPKKMDKTLKGIILTKFELNSMNGWMEKGHGKDIMDMENSQKWIIKQ